MNMLEIKDLRVAVDGKEILKGLSLSVKAGEVHAIMGPNGSGKSTLAYVLAGRDGYVVTEGDILWNGQSLLPLPPDERAAAGVFLAFQYPMEIPGVAGLTFLRTAINGTTAQLLSVFVKLASFASVEYIDVLGKDLATAAPVTERVKR